MSQKEDSFGIEARFDPLYSGNWLKLWNNYVLIFSFRERMAAIQPRWSLSPSHMARRKTDINGIELRINLNQFPNHAPSHPPTQRLNRAREGILELQQQPLI